MELEQDHYDVIVIGTGVAESIAAASLANSGKSVLHLDPNEYYGSAQASLTLDELENWINKQSGLQDTREAGPSTHSTASLNLYSNASIKPSPISLSETLAFRQRQYAISLFPAVLPSRGSLIQTLIESGVSKYVGFRLLDGVSMWDEDEGPIKYKGKGKATKVPGSKEEVFKDKSVSLVDKRRLMRFLMFVAGNFEADELFKDKAEMSIIDLLTTTFSLPLTLAERVAYAISHCSSLSEPSLSALRRTQRFLKSIGRYGPSAFLIGQYGGAGEIAQGFCRACAVKGGTYVLGEQAIPSSMKRVQESEASGDPTGKWQFNLPCHPRPVTATHIISTPEHVSALLRPANNDALVDIVNKAISIAHCVAVLPSIPECLDKSADLSGDENTTEKDDTGVVIFAPEAESGDRVVRALLMGEGTGSCPSGQYILYLTKEIDPTTAADPKQVLEAYIQRIQPDPLLVAYYISHPSGPASRPIPAQQGIYLLQPYAGPDLLTEGLDWEAEQGRLAWESVMGSERNVVEGENGWWVGMGPSGEEEEGL